MDIDNYFRKEKDSLGEILVPVDTYYGAHTQRAKENFPISGLKLQPDFIKTYAIIKKAAARANLTLKKLDEKKTNAIIQACDEVISGKYLDHFVVDVYQAGAGTSTNMNVNEVIANRANELLGGKKGEYNLVHPNDHLNMSQSTNDTFHTCTHIAVYTTIQEKLLPALKHLQAALEKKSHEFSHIVKIGRTHMQDAVPLTLGQEFSGYVGAISHLIKWVDNISESLLELSIGATAIGTSLNAGSKYVDIVIREINKITKKRFEKSKNFFNASQNQNVEAEVSGVLKSVAIGLSKISNDLILLSSGPNTGLNEIILPAVQPGSSIMPGKINPTIPEMINMVCFQVIGNDAAITEAARSGQLELNVYMPLVAYNLMNSVEILTNAINIFTEKCVKGIKANEKKIKEHLEKNPIIVTALTPYIGYQKAAEIAKEAYEKNKTIKEILLEKRLFTEREIDKILDLTKLVKPY